MTSAALVARWRELAEAFARYGQAGPAALLRACADELEVVTTAASLEALTLAQAATESGLSYSGIEKAVRAGRIPNAGAPGKPLIRRADLPRKARRPVPSLAATVGRRGPRPLDARPPGLKREEAL